MLNGVNMSKTVPLEEDVHALILDKQKDLKKKRNITVRISDLLAMYVKDGIDRTEKLLGLKEDENSDKDEVKALEAEKPEKEKIRKQNA